MGLLAVEHASMFYGAVAAPVGDGGEGVVGDVPGRGPALQHHWLWGRDPLQPARGHVAPGLPDRLTDGHEMAVAGEAHVDALYRLPELGEGRVEVQVCSKWDVIGQRLVGQ